jgi:Holliday junction resolvase
MLVMVELLWMNGFLVAHLGGTQTVQVPGPDIIAMSRQTGHFAVIECTTKHLGSGKKLPDLVANAEKLRRKLDAAGQGHRKILKILVTTLRADDIAAEREDAERLGVVVLTRENIETAIDRSIVIPNPEGVYADALQSAQAGIDKHAGQATVPGVSKSVDDA